MMLERRASDEQIRAVLAAAGACGAWDWDIVTDRLFVDERFAELYGFDSAELENGLPTSTFFNAIHQEDRARIRIAVAGMLSGAELFSKEFRVVTPSGTVLWMHGRGQSHSNEDDQPVRFTGLLVDVTERKRTEERLRIAQSAGGVGTFEYSDGYATVSVSHEFCHLLGLHPTDRLPVRTINYVLMHEGEQLIPEGKDAVIPNVLDADFEISRGDDGERRWIARRGEIIRDGTGYRLLGVIYDITEAKEQGERLRRLADTLEQRVTQAVAEKKVFADVLESSTAAVTALDTDFKILAINPANVDAFERVFGRRPKVGDAFLALFDENAENQAEQRRIWSRALSGETFSVVQEFGDDDFERRWYEVRFGPLVNRDGETIGASSHSFDVTDRVTAETQLAAAQEQLRQAQKMEAMGQLTGGVAHDFNNLLTPIFGSLDMLQRKGLGNEREQKLIEGAAQSAERARTLVHRLLAFARRQPLQTGAVDIGALVKGMTDLITSTSGPQVQLKLNVGESLPLAHADPNQLEMALLNLGVNARDAMPHGGVLRISATQEEIGAGHRSGLQPGNYLSLIVSDTGHGMDEGTMARAIEPFFSTKGIGKGTGLGLSMVHGLATQLGGALTLSSEVGRGTDIELWLPLSQDPLEIAKPAEEVPDDHARGRVLLVDDEVLIRFSTADMLSEFGYEVIEASCGEDALELVRRGFQPDILITDHLMPGMTGIELARALAEDYPDLPTLVVSGYAEGDGIAPGFARLTKPFRGDELLTSLNKLRQK